MTIVKLLDEHQLTNSSEEILVTATAVLASGRSKGRTETVNLAPVSIGSEVLPVPVEDYFRHRIINFFSKIYLLHFAQHIFLSYFSIICCLSPKIF